mmetsp:Transcript_13747/g.26637  ORF Transcript_13747/g.26637 Transcript_13747/m.26637 type:complete len:636 (+) Transcript_13747:226-2133(+)|eukprot:CAMPEP_0171511694 /NCGR_PEP_ID=MMETSP0959-20130129/1143_1 /TAXON_ID=87120 /ORGANISM="Aurantiochytrium limacinum, Strain ATCCMYA-1381" /LENGTH=635 /DNA_ID=CAMNT_0012049361 /DNA_START=123 /DNA_END=2030 /DNA_ORIENTATION=-
MEDAQRPLKRARGDAGIDAEMREEPWSISPGPGLPTSVLDAIMPMVAAFFSQAEARALLSPVSKGMRRAAARATTVTVEMTTQYIRDVVDVAKRSNFLPRLAAPHEEGSNIKDGGAAPGDDDEEGVVFMPAAVRSSKDNDFIASLQHAVSPFPRGEIWRPFVHSSKVLEMGLCQCALKVIVFVTLNTQQLEIASSGNVSMRNLNVGDSIALPMLRPQAFRDFEQLDWELQDIRVIRVSQEHDCIKVALKTPADLAETGSWRFKALGYFDLGKVFAKHQNKPPCDGLVWADDVVPTDLIERFNKLVDDYALDHHPEPRPFTDNVAVDYIHPGLPIYVTGVSPFVPSKDLPNAPVYPANGAFSPKYQMLTTYFDISTNKQVSIRNDLAGLRPAEKYPEMYECIARIFQMMIPRLEAVLSSHYWWRNFYCADRFLDEQGKLLEHRLERIDLAGQSLQVIVNTMEYILQPGQSFSVGNWHVGGLVFERIVLNSVYMLERDEGIEGGDLLFRRFIMPTESKFLHEKFKDASQDFQNLWTKPLVPIGRMQTPAHRSVVFPTGHLMTPTTIKNTSNKVARCRLLIYLVADPDSTALSTQEVPDLSPTFTVEESRENLLNFWKERHVNQHDLANYLDYLTRLM